MRTVVIAPSILIGYNPPDNTSPPKTSSQAYLRVPYLSVLKPHLEVRVLTHPFPIWLNAA